MWHLRLFVDYNWRLTTRVTPHICICAFVIEFHISQFVCVYVTVVVSFRMHKVVTPCNWNGYVSRRDSTNRRYASVTKSRLGPWHSQVWHPDLKCIKVVHIHICCIIIFCNCYKSHLWLFVSFVMTKSRLGPWHSQVCMSRSKVYQSCAHTHICTCMSWSWLTTRLTVEVRIWTRDQVGAKCASISVHTFVQDQIHKWP